MKIYGKYHSLQKNTPRLTYKNSVSYNSNNQISKYKSRSFRPQPKISENNSQSHNNNISNEPSPIMDDDVEIRGLMDDDEDDDEQESERLFATQEEEKKRKALLRYEKQQKQRKKEKEEAKERRRLKEEEKKKKKKAKILKEKMKRRQQKGIKKREELRKKRKKELETYAIDEVRPTREQIINNVAIETTDESETINQTIEENNNVNVSDKSDSENDVGMNNVNRLGDNENNNDDEDTKSKSFKQVSKKSFNNWTHGLDEDTKMVIDIRSAVQSIQRVDEYKGNEEITNLRKLYKQQFKMKQKPKDIDNLIDDHTIYICKELKQCICKNTRYNGLANFGSNGELGIEIEFTSDCDENGYISGKRVIRFKGLKQVEGKGRIWMDLYWNGDKYIPCTKFEWIDEGEGVTTKFWFDSVCSKIDVDHSFFQGNCMRYPSDLDPKKRSTKFIMHEGFFDFVCVSNRIRRNIRKNSLLQYLTLDINEMDENQLEKVPKYVRRMTAYSEKIDQLYVADASITKEILFGAIGNVV